MYHMPNFKWMCSPRGGYIMAIGVLEPEGIKTWVKVIAKETR